jgi:hypothetical protein
MSPPHRFVRSAPSALLPLLSRYLEELADHRSRSKRRGTVHVRHPGRALPRRPERLACDSYCCIQDRARSSCHPLQPHFRVGRILSDQLPSSAVVTFLSVVNPQPRPAALVARLRSTRTRSGHFLSHVPERLALPFLGLGEQTTWDSRIIRTRTDSSDSRLSGLTIGSGFWVLGSARTS